MLEFSEKLETHVKSLLTTWVGPGSDTIYFVKYFDDHLHDVEETQLPFVVVTLRTAEASGRSEQEIGVPYDLGEYTIHIYYLDTTADYAAGKKRRSFIMSKIEKLLEENRRLQNFEVAVDNSREYVWDSRISSVLFDYSGQEEYHSFVSELYLSVDTAKN